MNYPATSQIPIVDVVAAAHTWTIDEIVKRQPGAYPTDMEGDRWTCWHSMFGTVREARQVSTGPHRTLIRQEVRTTLPSGQIKIYTVTVTVDEREEPGHEQSGDDVLGPAIGELPPADPAPGAHLEADPADPAQAAAEGEPGPHGEAGPDVRVVDG